MLHQAFIRILNLLGIFLLSIFSYSNYAYSQEIQASAKIDTNIIKIGDQLKLSLQVKYQSNINLSWLNIPDTINKIEVVERLKTDTLNSSNFITQKQNLIITSFDSGYHVIPPFIFSFKKSGDTTTYFTETEPLLLTVQTVAVDTTKAFKDIKQPLEVPFTFQEALPYIIGILILTGIIFLMYYFFKRRKKIIPSIIPRIPSKPPHEVALAALRQLESEKLWQKGKLKLYYSRLSDIIRTYIEYRFHINALELTTYETLKNYNPIDGDNSIEKLKPLLELSDLVKFAKANPIASENEISFNNAVKFVELTMPHHISSDERREDKQ